ncbi:MAG: hypothetical protein NTZ05_17220 [Chloroflexi bacterium]|nr:hypothetical protein [Chloroflexota bacterium]
MWLLNSNTLLSTPLGASLDDDGLALDDLPANLLTGDAQLKLNPTAPRDGVERLALAGMSDHGVPFIEQANGVRIWRDFVKKRHPSLERPPSGAAALDYIMALMEFRKGTQGEIGKTYGVSAATVATRYKEIVAALNLVQFDDRSSLRPQSKNELFTYLTCAGRAGPRVANAPGRRPGQANLRSVTVTVRATALGGAQTLLPSGNRQGHGATPLSGQALARAMRVPPPPAPSLW